MTVTLETEFSETGQSEPWKNDVAKELNALLKNSDCERMDKITVSIVQRVSDFEEISVLKGEE